MQAVLDAPVGADECELRRAHGLREKEEAAGGRRAGTGLAAAFDDTNGGHTGEAVRLGEPWSRVDGGAPFRDAAVIGVRRRGDVVLPRRRIGEEERDIGLDAAPVALRGEHVIGALVANRLCGLFLAMHRVGRHHGAVEVEQSDQRAHGGNFIRLARHAVLAEHHASRARVGAHHMQRRGARGLVEGAPQGLAPHPELCRRTIATTPSQGAAAAKPSMNFAKHSENAAGSSRRNRRENVS